MPFEMLERRTLLAAGAPDITFGGTGSVLTTFTQGNDIAKAVVVQSDGRIIVAGTTAGTTGNITTSSDFSLARYNTNGGLDTSNGSNGRVTTDIGQFDNAFGVLLQPDGKIVVVGEVWNGTNFDFGLVRYNNDLTLDPFFGAGGVRTVNFGFGNDSAQAVAQQIDGRLVVVGTMFNGTNLDFALARFNTNGTLDVNFGNGGVANTGIGTANDIATKVLITSDGRILVAGTGSNVGQNSFMALAQYLTNASRDTTYGINGVATVGLGDSDTLTGLQFDIVGRTIVSGTALRGGNNDFLVARLNGNGVLDGGFGGGGGVVTADFGSANDFALGLAVQGDGKPVLVGVTSVNGFNQFAIARFTPAGALDSFGSAGKVITSVGPGNSTAEAAALQADGKLVVVGQADNPPVGVDFAVARYLMDNPTPQGDPDSIVRMYRAYNPTADYHFFTTGAGEFQNAVNNGYVDETTGRAGFSVRAGQASGSVPIHRMYNPNSGRHYYTLADGERNLLVAVGWTFEKDEGYMYRTLVGGTTEIFRLYNNNTGTHLFTESAATKDAILARFPGTWVQHNSLGFAYATAAAASSAEWTQPAVAAAETLPAVPTSQPPTAIPSSPRAGRNDGAAISRNPDVNGIESSPNRGRGLETGVGATLAVSPQGRETASGVISFGDEESALARALSVDSVFAALVATGIEGMSV